MTNTRIHLISEEIERIDNYKPSRSLPKHIKMATSPFVFYRGSAQLFYADIKAGLINFPKECDSIPLTSVMGDCHTSNFGFLTEEGSHGDTVIFSPNDFDDACVGKAHWDILRYLTSLRLAQLHCSGIVEGRYSGEGIDTTKPVVTHQQVISAQHAFIKHYVETCDRVVNNAKVMNEAIDYCPNAVPSKLTKLYKKAKARSAGGEEFTIKSALAKAVSFNGTRLGFKPNSDKFETLSEGEYKTLHEAFAPYMDDSIVDIVKRLNAGTGSVNMARYYFLVGPSKPHNEKSFAHCHIVEVKQQRNAAPLHYFPTVNPVNRLNAAHLTARCQRRMQRKPDLVLDEVKFKDAHYLIRSRHHAKVGVDPQDIAMGKKALNGGFEYFAQLCGYSLALAHCRGDRRSTRFAQSASNAFSQSRDLLVKIANLYADQVVDDHALFSRHLESN
ncbi:DUF2252 family protein [Alteromonas macleodii]|uniref:DUF2252 domain-containing protein n=1 Tax=Alteromonas macleodii TaxID=28108 RepID=A0A6T9Y4W8_ALTMA|nr:DUF2252 family protein [Alteromonas macleodii]CAB9493754.1 conserved protein of unknown function [Alteromonas macleodii]